jgi:hypothetical protein
MKNKETVRITITMPNTTKSAIDELADRMGISESSAAQHLLKIGLTVEAVAFDGGNVIAHTSDGGEHILADRMGNFVIRLISTSV